MWKGRYQVCVIKKHQRHSAHISRIMELVNIIIGLFVTEVVRSSGEIYTAVADLENLLKTESEVLNAIDMYIKAEKLRIQKIKKLREEYKQIYQAASHDSHNFFSNPINAFVLLKRLTSDWKAALELIINEKGKELFMNMTSNREDITFPDDEDLNGSALALFRLQDTYKLNISSLARGQIKGQNKSIEMNAYDCFELGRQSYNIARFNYSVEWMQEALKRIDQETNKTEDQENILEYMAASTYMQGNMQLALKITNDILELSPSHPRARAQQMYLENAIKNASNARTPFQQQLNSLPQATDFYDRETYTKICRGERVYSPNVEKKLKCRYVHKNNPYLLLQPIKEEEFFPKPRLVVYHDIVTPLETVVLKKLAHPKLQRAAVLNPETGAREIGAYRIGKSTWLTDEEHPVVAKVRRRVEDVTGLDIKTAEALQVLNYGIGGHYDPHYDFAKKGSIFLENRIATCLFYMSDVEAGGATVFPKIGVSVPPKKGSALFWYNLHRNGEGDMLTLHAGCPVLTGSKWVANIWFSQLGQEQRRPCGLKFND